MEARIRRVDGGFPGYDGPALPRGLRSQRGRAGDAAKGHGVNLARTGVFELLATVAGQILQDARSDDPNAAKQGDGEGARGKSQSGMDSQISGLDSVKDFTSVDKPQSCGSGNAYAGGVTHVSSVDEVSVEGSNDGESASCGARSPAQEEDRGTFVKDVVVDEGSGAVVHTKGSAMEGVVMAPVCDSDMSSTQAGGEVGSPCCDVKEMVQVWGTYGGSREVERYSVEEVGGAATSEGVACDTAAEEKTHAAVEVVGEEMVVVEAGVGVKQASSKLQAVVSEEQLVCSKSMEAEGVRGPMHGGGCEGWKRSAASVPEMHMQCKMSESEEYGESAEVMEGGEGGMEDDDAGSRGVEERNVVVSGKSKGRGGSCGRYAVASPGVAECKSTRPMVRRVMSRVEGKFYKREHAYRTSQRVHPETMTTKVESYSRSLKVRRAVKVAKRNHVGGTRAKRQHAEMESTDSGCSEDCGYGKKSYLGGIGAYTRQRTTRGAANKRRKVADGSPKTGPDLHLSSSDLMELEYECVGGEPPAAAAKIRSAKAASVASSPTSRSAKLGSKKSAEAHVKLSIKSFTVPELLVDLPETASVGSLKRAVMDAAMNLLGGGLRVRVLMQGKKVPDEGATLSQIGISREAKAESVGFMLEPSPGVTSSCGTGEDPLLVLSRAANQPAPRYPVYGVGGVSGVGDGSVRCAMKGRASKSSGTVVDPDPSYVPPSASSEQEGYVDGRRNGVVSPEESVKGCNKHVSERMAISAHPTRVAAAGALAAIRAQADASRRGRNEMDSGCTSPESCGQDSVVGGSGAIILHPGVSAGENVGGMALVPLRNKMPRALDNGKRRVRRPFSVQEVEALVHAVEKLGTGRWRDVKLRAFEQAKHRTYVDLKDKWKTLVHTARIAPHQRRGEPVPQDLLDRVTRAHAFWTAHAAKQQADLDS